MGRGPVDIGGDLQNLLNGFDSHSSLKYASVLELEDSPDLGSGAQAYGFESLQRYKNIGVYLLSLIRSRKSKWLHVRSNPITPTKWDIV